MNMNKRTRALVRDRGPTCQHGVIEDVSGGHFAVLPAQGQGAQSLLLWGWGPQPFDEHVTRLRLLQGVPEDDIID